MTRARTHTWCHAQDWLCTVRFSVEDVCSSVDVCVIHVSCSKFQDIWRCSELACRPESHCFLGQSAGRILLSVGSHCCRHFVIAARCQTWLTLYLIRSLYSLYLQPTVTLHLHISVYVNPDLCAAQYIQLVGCVSLLLALETELLSKVQRRSAAILCNLFRHSESQSKYFRNTCIAQAAATPVRPGMYRLSPDISVTAVKCA